jgi:ECF transporter S component (folate family)
LNTKSAIIKITTVALMIAMEILLTRFLSIQTPIIRISFGFIPIALLGIKFGPLHAGSAAMIADLMGFWLFPPPFPFFPGFTFTAFLTGAVYGIFMHNKPGKMLNIVIAAAVVVIGLNFVLDTIWLTIIQQVSFGYLFWFRILRTLIMLPLQIVGIKFAAEAAKAAKLL